ncbi:hypothetical protein ABTE31_19800, partial [Acinetobacter baumannii]
AALAAVAVVATPMIASAAVRPAPFRYAKAIKKANGVGEQVIPAIVVGIPAAATVVVAAVEVSKSNG